MSRVAGLLEVQVNGNILQAKGSFDYNLGKNKKTAVVGHDRVHGYKELPQVPYIEGEITDASDLDVESLMEASDVTITLKLANGKVILLESAWYAADGVVGTEEANIEVRYEGLRAEEIRA